MANEQNFIKEQHNLITDLMQKTGETVIPLSENAKLGRLTLYNFMKAYDGESDKEPYALSHSTIHQLCNHYDIPFPYKPDEMDDMQWEKWRKANDFIFDCQRKSNIASQREFNASLRLKENTLSRVQRGKVSDKGIWKVIKDASEYSGLAIPDDLLVMFSHFVPGKAKSDGTQKKSSVELVGYVDMNKGDVIHFYKAARYIDCPFIEQPNHTIHAIEFRGSGRSPYTDGALAFYQNTDNKGVADECLGRDCVVTTADGKILLKKIEDVASSTKFTLVGSDGESKQTALQSASKILWVQQS